MFVSRAEHTDYLSEILFISEKNFDLKCSVFKNNFSFVRNNYHPTKLAKLWTINSPSIKNIKTRWRYSIQISDGFYFKDFYWRGQITFRRSLFMAFKSMRRSRKGIDSYETEGIFPRTFVLSFVSWLIVSCWKDGRNRQIIPQLSKQLLVRQFIYADTSLN